VSRVVVIATSKVDRDALDAVLEPDDELHVVIPAVEQSRLQWLASDEDEARADAEEIGEQIERDAPGDAATVDVKPDAPSQVLRDAIAEHAPDRIVVAVRDGESASWLEEDELERLPAAIDGVPVTRLTLSDA
jgi:hypothetical protein